MKVQITLDPSQTRDEAEEQLYKAFQGQREGAPHDSGTFPDPAMQHVADLMKEEYQIIYATMMRKIEDALDAGEEF